MIALMLVAPQAVAQDVRLSARLDKPTLVAVNAIVDSARVAKLPTAPLVDKALEGAAKGSDDRRRRATTVDADGVGEARPRNERDA
jgi:hypothetical protein